MKRSFSDLTGDPVTGEFDSVGIEYSHPLFEVPNAVVMARVSFRIENHPTETGRRPDLNKQDIITLLRGLFETFRDSRPGA